MLGRPWCHSHPSGSSAGVPPRMSHVLLLLSLWCQVFRFLRGSQCRLSGLFFSLFGSLCQGPGGCLTCKHQGLFNLCSGSYRSECNILQFWKAHMPGKALITKYGLQKNNSGATLRSCTYNQTLSLPCIFAKTYSNPFTVFVTLPLNLARPNSYKNKEQEKGNSEKHTMTLPNPAPNGRPAV